MSKEIRKYDERGNLIYHKNSTGYEIWREYDKNNKLFHQKQENGCDYWFKYNEDDKPICITEKEYKEIEFQKKEKEYLSRTKCSRFEIMDI